MNPRPKPAASAHATKPSRHGRRSRLDIYGGRSPLELSVYTIADAARYLRLPASTVLAWTRGHPRQGGRTPPIIAPADPVTPRLSFENLVEIHVLSALRQRHRVRLEAIRRAVAFLRKKLAVERPLADAAMETDGKGVLVREAGRLINASEDGQLEMAAIVDHYLKRVDRDPGGLAVRLFPLYVGAPADERRSIVIDPCVRFGRPCVASTGVPTAAVASRYRAGEAVAAIAEDMGTEVEAVVDAIAYEEAQRRAA